MKHLPIRYQVCLMVVAGVALAAPRVAAQQAPVDRPAAAARVAPPTVGTGPNGATLRCRDGSYPAPKAPDSACAANGGVLVRFPLRYLSEPATATAPTPPTPAQRAPAAVDRPRPDGFVPLVEVRARGDTLRGPPIGATLLCKDGSYILRDTSASLCQSRGGLHLRLGAPRTP